MVPAQQARLLQNLLPRRRASARPSWASRWQFGKGGRIGEFPEDLRRFFNSSTGGYLYWPDAVWLLGLVLVMVGVLALAWGCVRVLHVRAEVASQNTSNLDGHRRSALDSSAPTTCSCSLTWPGWATSGRGNRWSQTQPWTPLRKLGQLDGVE